MVRLSSDIYLLAISPGTTNTTQLVLVDLGFKECVVYGRIEPQIKYIYLANRNSSRARGFDEQTLGIGTILSLVFLVD